MPIHRIAALVAGAAGITLGILSLSGPAIPDENWGSRGALVNALGLVTFAALAVALEMLREPLRLTRLGRAGLRSGQVGLTLMCIESIASQVHNGNTLGPVFMVGLLVAIVGLTLTAVGGWHENRWLAPLPLLALLVGIAAGDRGGFAVLGLVWLILSVTTVSTRSVADRRPMAATDKAK